jgi:hypothetical protein
MFCPIRVEFHKRHHSGMLQTYIQKIRLTREGLRVAITIACYTTIITTAKGFMHILKVKKLDDLAKLRPHRKVLLMTNT